MKLFVKICGVRSYDDAYAAFKAGADAIGFNFWSGSKRYLPVEEAARIAKRLPSGVRTVGVFVDAPEDEIVRAFSSGACDWVQLHGGETPEFCRRFAGRYMKAVRLAGEASLASLDLYSCDVMLVDADTAGFGGSGQRADVELARRAAEKRRILLAGGLTPENVAEAVRAVRPWGVDVASGVERAPGEKDHEKIKAFIKAARRALRDE